jgi:hypothetical protein
VNRRHRVVGRPEHRELRRPSQDVNEFRGQLRPRHRLPRAGRPTRERCERWDADPADQETDRQDETGCGQERGRDRDGESAGDQSDERRSETSQEQVLHRVDVAHHASEQVAAPERRSSTGYERLQPPVEAHPHPCEHAERQVVGLETLEVPGHGLADAARADGHDRGGERQDRRVLGGARDHVAGERHQPHAQEDRERTERNGSCDPCPGQSRDAKQCPDRAHGSTA